MEIGIEDPSLKALDGRTVLEALAERARTPLGRAAVAGLRAAEDVGQVRVWLDEVDEVLELERDGVRVPMGGVDDVRDPVGRAERGGMLEESDLRRVGLTLDVLEGLARWLQGHGTDVPRLQAIAPGLVPDASVRWTLAGAFDAQGELSARTWPELGELRARVAELHTRIRRTLDELVRGDTLADVLQDRFVTQRSDRYVLPIKANTNRRELGIVHGMSGSGQTAFIEPHAVVELNNDLRLAEGALEAQRRRILQELSGMVGRAAPGLLQALREATRVDLACARAALARDLEGTRPVVGSQGRIALKAARHPVLVLRGVQVVANDLTLDAEAPVLVVSGPNTGGKTIALKTVGLCALLVRLGCRVPAAEGSRVDLFRDVVALIGDHQSVQADQSSFSSHVAALADMVRRARPGLLVLVDEIASGTDPEQGSALAHAVLERLAERGARVLVTTHFHRLKGLSAQDPRIATAGMQFADGHPTYRLVPGASGDSHALEVALRMGLPSELVDRARALMDQGERSLAEALAAVDRERERAVEASERAERLAAEAAAARAVLARRERELEARADALAQERVASLRARLDAAEAAVGGVVAELQRSPSPQGARAARASLDAARRLADEVAPAPSAAEVAPAEVLEVGDRVRLAGGQTGEVLDLGRRVRVRTARGLVVQVEADQVVRLGPRAEAPVERAAARAESAPPAPVDPESALRTDSNSVDLRGQRVEEGLELLERSLAEAALRDQPVVFVLHGHGTGAMKQAVRRWLATCPAVSRSRPAGPDQGGDAWTVAVLR